MLKKPLCKNASSCQLKLVDFGVSAFKPTNVDEAHGYHEVIGSKPYMAPEVFNGNYGTQSDMFSLGVVIFQMISGKKPFLVQTIGLWHIIASLTELLCPSPKCLVGRQNK